MLIHVELLLLFIILEILFFGDANLISGKPPASPVQIERSNSTNNGSVDAIELKTNFSRPAAPVSPPAINYSLRHIPRKRRQVERSMEFMDLHTTHLPCEFDTSQRQVYLPNHCAHTFNKRYSSEASYKVFQLYRLEGFMFGQYYERLLRYETEPPTYDYRNIGL